MGLHHFQAYIDRKRQKRKALQMLALSGVVRPSHVELRYTTPILTVDGQMDSFQDTPAPPTMPSNLCKTFVDAIHRLTTDLRSLRPCLPHQGLLKLRKLASLNSHLFS
jgi:hypothetical protein